jgi:hypothetical protein
MTPGLRGLLTLKAAQLPTAATEVGGLINWPQTSNATTSPVEDLEVPLASATSATAKVPIPIPDALTTVTSSLKAS